nr:unnamed protein product [Amyelois transitella]
MDYSSEEEFDNYINEHDEHSIINTRKVIRDFQDPFDYYSSEEFRRRYRFTKDVVHFVLLPLINKDLEKLTARGLPVPPLYQLLVSLRFYASGSFQMITGDLISISQPTVSRIVKRVSHLFCLKVQEFIKFPNNLQRRLLCDSLFSWDNRSSSSLKRKMEQGIIDGILLGDSGYGCQRYLLTPVAQPENNSEENYNKAHIKTRNTVERTIGAWKRIFPCLSKKMATNLTTSCNVIVATAVLYNICRAHGVIEHIEPDNRNIQRTTRNVQQSRETREGLLFRRLFISRHF